MPRYRLGGKSMLADIARMRPYIMSGMIGGSIEFRYKLAEPTIVGATSANLNIVYPSALAYQTYIIVDPFTVECECRLIKSISGTTYGFAALTYAHAATDLVFFMEIPWLPLLWFGGKPDAGVTDNITAIDRGLVQASGAGGGAAKLIVTPGIFDTSGKVTVPVGVELGGLTPIGITGEVSKCCIRAKAGFPGSTPLIQLGTTGSYQSGLRLSGLLIDCAQRASIGVYTEVASEHSKVDNSWIIDATSKGLFFDSSPTGRYASNNFIENLTVTFPNAAGTEIGIHIIGGASPTGNFSHQRGGSNITINASTAINAGILLENYAGGMFDRVHGEDCADVIRLGSPTTSCRSVTLANVYGVNCTDVIEIADNGDSDNIVITSAFRSGGTNIINDLLSGVALTDARTSVYQIGNTHQYIGSRSYTHTIKRTFNHNLTDNVATSVFRITTTDESGNNDSGAYSVFVKAIITQPQGSGTGAPVASKAYMGTFCRSMVAAGTGVNSAVTDIAISASAATASATRDIGTVTMSVVEVNEYNIDVQFTVDSTGSGPVNPEISCEVEVVWVNFLTAPTIGYV